jgi:hypothetical protein
VDPVEGEAGTAEDPGEDPGVVDPPAVPAEEDEPPPAPVEDPAPAPVEDPAPELVEDPADPVEDPAVELVELDAVEGCDPAQALVEVPGGGCAVLVTFGDAWTEVGVFGLVLIVASLAALVVGQYRRG